MARASFLIDEHLPKAVARGLRARGVDAITVAEASALGADDASLLAQARTTGRVLLTQDVDFLRLHAAGVPHAGIAYVPRTASVGSMIRGVLLVAQVLDSEAMTNHVEFL